MFHRHKNTNSNSAEIPASGPLAAGQQGGFQQQNTIVAAPIVQESIRNDRIVEVQPVVHRSVDQNIVHHIERHIQEPAAPSMGNVIERPPLIQEHYNTNVVQEVQPVIHRERVVPVTERAERHFAERVTGPTVHTHEVIYEQGNQGYQGYQGQSQQPIGVLRQTQAVPLYAPPMGTPYATSNVASQTGGKIGKRHHHGVLHRNAH